MKKIKRLLKNKIFIASMVSVVGLLIVGGVWYFIYDFLNDYRCSTMPINEFFQDKKCEKYWRYR